MRIHCHRKVNEMFKKEAIIMLLVCLAVPVLGILAALIVPHLMFGK